MNTTGTPLSPGLVEWLASGHRGTSSNTMVTHLTGINAVGNWGMSHPYDPSDLGRCRKLIEQVPGLAVRLPEMATLSREWARLVGEWDALCSMMDEEAPQWREGIGSCPKTYARMQELMRPHG